MMACKHIIELCLTQTSIETISCDDFISFCEQVLPLHYTFAIVTLTMTLCLWVICISLFMLGCVYAQ